MTAHHIAIVLACALVAAPFAVYTVIAMRVSDKLIDSIINESSVRQPGADTIENLTLAAEREIGSVREVS